MCEQIELRVCLEKVQGCLEHSNSEVLAYFISFLPKRFDQNLAIKFDPT